MAYYWGVYFSRQDIINAFEFITQNGAPSGKDLRGKLYNVLYNGYAYNVKALFKVICNAKGVSIGKFASTQKLRDEFKKEGFGISGDTCNSNIPVNHNFPDEKKVSSLSPAFVVKKKAKYVPVKDYKELFNLIMNSLFSAENKEKTLEYYKNTHYRGISSEKGIYVVKNSENQILEILDTPEILLFDEPNDTKSHNESEKGFKVKCKSVSNLYLYIGKTDGNYGIKNRLTKYIKYGYGGRVKHHGGYHLWFVKNNKSLYANYATLDEIKERQSELYSKAEIIHRIYHKSVTEIIEMGLICLHDLAYGYAPLGNSQEQSEYKSYKSGSNSVACNIYNEWKKYWRSKLNK